MLRKNKKFLPKALKLDSRNVALSSSVAAILLALCSCTSSPIETALPETVMEGRHLEAPDMPDPESAPDASEIPEVVSTLPLLTLPEPVEEPDLYSVSVMNVPVRDLLFTVARDAAINIDIHPSITG
jgi:hypothetical protein